MKKYKILFLVFVLVTGLRAQVLQWTPYFAKDTDSLTVTFDASQGSGGLAGYTGDVYAHTGVITNLSTSNSDWKYVKTNWGVNTAETKLTRIGTNLYQYKIAPAVRAFYAVPGTETIQKIAFVFRSSAAPYLEGKNSDGSDIFLPLASAGFNVAVTQPNVFPVIVVPTTTIPVTVQATLATSLSLYIDNQLIQTTSGASITYNYVPATAGRKWIKAVASNGTTTKADSAAVIVRPPVTDANLPAGVKDGINYTGPTSATLVIHAPMKNYFYVIGDFNNWDVLPEYYMNRTPDGQRWWITINNLSPGMEYAYQYFVDGTMRIPDPYSEKILDPWNDKYIAAVTYPDLKAYPTGKTSQLVSCLQTAQSAFNWQVTNFTKPPKEKLVIYELLMRDFMATHSFQGLSDTLAYLKNLGVTAVQLMPVNEFDGNESWGYNPALHGALDKYYGNKTTFKQFIDKCHQNGMAVILDVVFNHAFGNNPLVRLWWDATNNRPADNNPYFNPVAMHPYSVGYDFNHESQATKDYLDNMLKYWLTEYKVDGFRFDLSKGFTQKNSGSDVGAWGAYDQSRINLLQRMANKIWSTDAGAYVILEHFADNSEEVVLANSGMMLWGKMTSNYNEATMGYHDNGKSDFNWISYKNRGYNNPNLVGYMESHDEERLMFKNITYGNVSGSYNVKDPATALNRMKMAGAFFFLVPGPKQIWQFGELGYDVTIQYPCGTDACRTDKKPIKWEYYPDANRIKLFKTWKELTNLKKTYAVFSTDNFNMDVSGALKKINLYHSSMNAVVVGNFNVAQGSISGNFPNAGTWYDFFTGNSVSITDPSAQLQLAPGEFHIYTSVKLYTPEPGLLTDIDKEFIAAKIPTGFTVEQNYPNPFNPSTRITFGLPQQAKVDVRVYDVLGNEVAQLFSGDKAAGYHSVNFNGAGLSSGVYLYTVRASFANGSSSLTGKMALTK